MKFIRNILSVVLPLIAVLAVFAFLYGFLLLGLELGMTM